MEILVCDPDLASLQLLKEQLEGRGHTVLPEIESSLLPARLTMKRPGVVIVSVQTIDQTTAPLVQSIRRELGERKVVLVLAPTIRDTDGAAGLREELAAARQLLEIYAAGANMLLLTPLTENNLDSIFGPRI